MADSQFPSNSPTVSVTEAQLSLSDVTTDDVSITKHGFVPKAPNDATKYLDGTGAFSTPSGGGGGAGVPLWNHPHFSNGWANNQNIGWGDGNMVGSTQNATYMTPFNIDQEVTAAYLRFFVTTTGGSSNNYDIGIYNSSGTLVANIGAQHLNSSGAQKIAFTQGSVTFTAGLYWLAITSNRSSGALFAISGVDPTLYPSSGGGIEMFWCWVSAPASSPYGQPSWFQPASGGTTSGGALNNSVTLVTLAAINIYDTYEYFNNAGSAYVYPRFALSAY